jgi:hypothetical protein
MFADRPAPRDWVVAAFTVVELLCHRAANYKFDQYASCWLGHFKEWLLICFGKCCWFLYLL